MTENTERGNKRWSAAETASAAEALDADDVAVLANLRALFDHADPVPDGLVERLRFAVALDEMMAEVAEISRLETAGSGVRSGPTETRTQTVTFSAESLTAMVTVQRTTTGELRLDGWISPARSVTVRMRMDGGDRVATSEPSGRFSFDHVPEGFAQLIFGADDGGASVVTPLFEL